MVFINYNEFIAKRIYYLRNEKNVSARDMSLSLGQSESYINKIENGKAMPSIKGLIYICEYFEITLKDFFDEDYNSPIKSKPLINEIRKLKPQYVEHIIALIKDLNEK